MFVVSHDSAQDLRRILRHLHGPKLAQRLRIITLAMEGHCAREIGHWIDLSSRQVQHWVRRHNQEGLLGLKDRAGRGPSPMLNAEQSQRLRDRLDSGPLPEDQVCTLRGKDVQRILEQGSLT